MAGVTGVIAAPQFPSPSDVFDQIKNKVCRIASDQVNGAVSDVNGRIGGVMNGIVNGFAKPHKSGFDRRIHCTLTSMPCFQRLNG